MVSVCFDTQASDVGVAKRASMFKDMHIRSLRQKLILKQRTEEAATKLEVRKIISELKIVFLSLKGLKGSCGMSKKTRGFVITIWFVSRLLKVSQTLKYERTFRNVF